MNLLQHCGHYVRVGLATFFTCARCGKRSRTASWPRMCCSGGWLRRCLSSPWSLRA